MYRIPYLLAACKKTFSRAAETKERITKQDMFNLLYIDEGLARSDPNIITDPLRLTSREALSLKSSRTSAFWLKHRRYSLSSGCSINDSYQSSNVSN